MDIGGLFASTVTSGALLVAIPLTMTAGLVGTALAFVRRHIRIVNIAGTSRLIVLGILLVSGVWVNWIY